MENDIIIRPITIEDKDGLVALYDRVWPETAGTKEGKTKWSIETAEYKGMCAVADGKIIGSRTAFHTNIYLGRQKLTCVQFGDSCVDKDFRRFGLFSRMNLAFLETYFKTGLELIYNISVEASKKAYKKVGWEYIESLSGLMYIPNYIRLLWKIKGDIRKLGGNVVVDSSSIPDVSVIPNSLLEARENAILASGVTIHTKYDQDTLKWRVQTDSGIKLYNEENVGACLYKTGTKNGMKVLVLGELFPVSYDFQSFRKLLKNVVAEHPVDLVTIAITPGHPLVSMYKKFGFFCNPKKKYLNHGVRVNSDLMKAVALNPNNWALSRIDIDTF